MLPIQAPTVCLIGLLGKGGLAHHPRGLVAHPVVFGGSPTTHIVVMSAWLCIVVLYRARRGPERCYLSALGGHLSRRSDGTGPLTVPFARFLFCSVRGWRGAASDGVVCIHNFGPYNAEVVKRTTDEVVGLTGHAANDRRRRVGTHTATTSSTTSSGGGGATDVDRPSMVQAGEFEEEPPNELAPVPMLPCNDENERPPAAAPLHHNAMMEMDQDQDNEIRVNNVGRRSSPLGLLLLGGNAGGGGSSSGSSSSNQQQEENMMVGGGGEAEEAGPSSARYHYRVGMFLDVLDTVGKWCEAEVLEVDHHAHKITITYLYWSEKFDEQLPFDSPRIAPFKTHTYHGDLSQLKVGDGLTDRLLTVGAPCRVGWTWLTCWPSCRCLPPCCCAD